MPDLRSTTHKNSATRELELIHNKKTALQQLIKLTTSLNHLSQGLQSVLVLGKSASSIPATIINSYKSMTSKLNPLATDKLQNSLTVTQIKIQSDIKNVLELSQKQESELDEFLQKKQSRSTDNSEQNFDDYVTDFKKKAQTSIALRIVLKSRNAIISAFRLPVPEAFVKKQIKALDKREVKYKKRIKKELSNLFKEITLLIENNATPESLLPELHHTRGQIINNINHFNAGKNIEDMPIVFENIEISSPEPAAKERSAIPEAEHIDEVMAEVEEIHIQPIKRSLGSRLWEWATTSADHHWEDISKNKDNKKL